MTNLERELKQMIKEMRGVGSDVQLVEVKESVGKLPASMGDTLSAFSNGSGGTVILGISEARGFTPAEGFEAKRMADALAGACSDRMTPPVRADIEIVPFEGTSAVVAKIPEMAPLDKPCYVTERGMYAGSFIRSFDGDRHLSAYEISRLLEVRAQPAYDADPVPAATLDDLDPDLVARFLAVRRASHPRIFGKLPDDKALVALTVAAPDVEGTLRPTLGGLLALGTYPQKHFPQLTITVSVYAGTQKALTDPSQLLAREKMAGPIPAIIHDTVDTVLHHAGSSSFPAEAVREAVCNALMHRDYSPQGRGMQTLVNLFADRLEIMSPGGLYGAVTVDTIGIDGYAVTRNQHLADILETTPYDDGFVAANRGSGFTLISALLEQARMEKPVLSDTLALFTLTLPRAKSDAADGASASASTSSAAAETTSPTDGNPMLAYLRAQGESSSAQIADALGMPRSTVNYRLAQLIDAGKVERLGPPRSSKQRYRAR